MLRIGLALAALSILASTLSACGNETLQATTAVATEIPAPSPPESPSPTPTQPATSPTPAPTLTPMPTAIPTPAPTLMPMPTAIPTPAPTLTPMPTAIPTPAPTLTPMPTAIPTPAPTLMPMPTAIPTPAPTLTPIPIATPTPAPTLPDTENTRWLKSNNLALYRQLQELPWVMDGTEKTEREVIDWLILISRYSKQAAAALIAMPWLQDGITGTEAEFLDSLENLNTDDRDIAAQVIAMPWTQDGITGTEAEFLDHLEDLEDSSKEAAATVMAMPWASDGITEFESEATKYLSSTAYYDTRAATSIVAIPWLQDGISRDEATVIAYLYSIIPAKDESLQQEVIQKVIEILAMPFLDTVESADDMAVRSLEQFEDAGSAEFLELMTHPSLSDGIDDEEAKIVALLGGINTYKPESVQVFLDSLLTGTGSYKEERTITLPHSGEVLLAIIRHHDHTNPNMDYLEHAVRHHEGFMGEPLPTNYIAWYFGYPRAGANFGTHIASNPIRDPAIGEYWRAPRHAAHETAHYYWTGSQAWIKEGGADMLVILSENVRVGRPLEHNRKQCLLANTISEIADAETGSDKYYCAYTLGQRLFLDLYRAIGEEAFQQAFHSLYLKRLSDDPADDCEGTYLGICHVEAAFKANVPGDMAARVDEIIGHWYYGRTATHEGDRAELVALYRATNGANWADNAKWLSGAHVGEWYGVATDADGRVIELNLAGNSLSGELPPGLGNLANLRELLLDDNRLRGSIPEELGSLDKLTRLELDDNGLTGEIPLSLGNLTNLTWLGLADNGLTGEIPSSLGSLIHMTRLELDGNDFSGEIPSSLGDLSALRYLRVVDHNRFTGCVPVGLTGVADNGLADSGLPSC